ncbi:MAG TPA: UDP-glucose/GDP-mannose dehydrogenase family protein [Candidatus Nanoarchaeia archaeon]|nr:UDP-glucose/GDP-mannose dehydrogenase family protein [Candidatus Nanoarchaeia archaeon]
MKIAVIGTGYVGLTTGACFAELGHTVICNDIDAEKVAKLKKAQCPIFEERLPELLTKHNGKNLTFTTSIQEAIKDAQVIFICVGTPPKQNGAPDLSFMEKVIKDIGAHLTHYAVIVEKSTVPIQTAEWMKNLLKKHLKTEFDVAVNPEFLREGTSVYDFLNPDRIVIGTETQKADKIMTEIYAKIKAPIIHTNLNSAELIKHASNSYLAMKISFANLTAQLCEKANADIKTVMEGVGMDKRIGKEFLNAGLGYGGFCFPKDLDAFITVLEKHKVDASLLKAVREINEKQREHVIKMAEEMLGTIKGKTIGILGLSFKPNTDDTRLSPALMLAQDLQKKGAKIRAYDPQAMENAKKTLNATYCKNVYETAEGADLLILATEWNEFKKMDLAKIKVKKFIDARNVFETEKMKKLGFEYRSIGRQ